MKRQKWKQDAELMRRQWWIKPFSNLFLKVKDLEGLRFSGTSFHRWGPRLHTDLNHFSVCVKKLHGPLLRPVSQPGHLNQKSLDTPLKPRLLIASFDFIFPWEVFSLPPKDGTSVQEEHIRRYNSWICDQNVLFFFFYICTMRNNLWSPCSPALHLGNKTSATLLKLPKIYCTYSILAIRWNCFLLSVNVTSVRRQSRQ